MQTLQDTFDTGLDKAVKWSLSSAGTVWDSTNQRVQVPCTKPTSSLLAPGITYDLTGSYAFAKIVIPPTGTGTRVTRLVCGDGGSNSLDIRVTGTSLSCVKNVAGTITQQAVGTYNSTTHAFWRVRESGGNALFDTSTDGLTWTNRWTTAKGINVTALYGYIECSYTGTETAATAFVDYFSQLHTVDAICSSPLVMSSTPVQSEIITQAGNTPFHGGSTPVQSEVIGQSTTSPLQLGSTPLQSEIINIVASTAFQVGSQSLFGLLANTPFGLNSVSAFGFSPNTSMGINDTIANDTIIMSVQEASTVLLFLDTLFVLQQGGRAFPDQVVEYLTNPAILRPKKKYRLIAQRILDRVFLDWDLPVSEVVITYTLSGPMLIKGKLKPEILDFLDLGLEPKATFIHVEQDDIIRGSTILQPSEIADDASLTFVAEGLSGYPHSQPYQGEYSQTNIDPIDVMRAIWTHLLASPRANLGLSIGSATSTQRIGTEIDTVNGTVKPYALFWWDDTDCGREIDNLARETPFDYTEFDVWNSTKTDVEHFILPHYPRAGHRRFDLAFIAGENIISVTLLREESDQYASEVIVRGAGEGRDSIRGFAANVIGNRIRQAVSVTDKSITTHDAATNKAEEELRRRQAFLNIREITILDQHENASLGDFIPGDDVLVQVELYWFGEIQMWCRIVGFDWVPEKGIIIVQLENSEISNYGAYWNRIELS